MEKKNEVLEKRLAAQNNATPDGYEALKTKLANALGASMTALQGQVGNLRLVWFFQPPKRHAKRSTASPPTHCAPGL
jgi:hypothetical protein